MVALMGGKFKLGNRYFLINSLFLCFYLKKIQLTITVDVNWFIVLHTYSFLPIYSVSYVFKKIRSFGKEFYYQLLVLKMF